MKALVVGGTGQLGANLVRALVGRGDHVRVLLRPTSRTFTLDGLDVELYSGDLRDQSSLVRACRGRQVVYQTAGYYPTETIPALEAKRQALQETRHLVEAVREASVDRLVFASSLTTVGHPKIPGQLATEDCAFSTAFVNNPYLIAKAAMEEEVLKAARNGVPAVVVIPTVFFGPYDRTPTSGTQILMIARRQMLGYIQGPVNVIDVRDVAEAMIRAAEWGQIGERYIVGNWNTTQRELNHLIARVLGVSPPLMPVPFAVARLGSKVMEGFSRAIFRKPPPIPAFFVEVFKHMQQYDCAKAIRELDYPRRPVEQAIRDAVAWFREHGYLPSGR